MARMGSLGYVSSVELIVWLCGGSCMWVGSEGECAMTHTLVRVVVQGGSTGVRSVVRMSAVSGVGL